MKKLHTSIRLNEIMEERHLKQVDVLRLAQPYAKRYGVKLGKSDISQYVSGKTEPQQQKLFILSKALNVNPSWLMGLDAPKEVNELQKSDAITDIIIKLRTDSELLDMVQTISELSAEQRKAVQTLLSAFNSK